MVQYDELIKNINVLLVDDDLDYLNITYMYLKSRGYQVDKVTSGEDALEQVKKRDYHIMLVDYFMPTISGEELINEIRKTNKEMIIILQTGFSGQKPPIESMEKMNIQNYHDKTEGIDRLNLELISAVKIFNQQNEIELTKYRSTAIGNLISSVASEIRSNLLTISAGIEYTNMILNDIEKNQVDTKQLIKINKFSQNNKEYLERIDKILSSIIKQLDVSNFDDIVKASDSVDIINLMLKNVLLSKGIILNAKMILKENTYLTGSINDSIFVICEIIRQISEKSQSGDEIKLILSEDEYNWYYKIENNNISKLDKRNIYLIKCIVISLKNVAIFDDNDSIGLSIKKIDKK